MAGDANTCGVCERPIAETGGLAICELCGLAVCPACDDGEPCEAGQARSAGSGQAYPAPEWDDDGFEEHERAETARRKRNNSPSPPGEGARG